MNNFDDHASAAAALRPAATAPARGGRLDLSGRQGTAHATTAKLDDPLLLSPQPNPQSSSLHLSTSSSSALHPLSAADGREEDSCQEDDDDDDLQLPPTMKPLLPSKIYAEKDARATPTNSPAQLSAAQLSAAQLPAAQLSAAQSSAAQLPAAQSSAAQLPAAQLSGQPLLPPPPQNKCFQNPERQMPQDVLVTKKQMEGAQFDDPTHESSSPLDSPSFDTDDEEEQDDVEDPQDEANTVRRPEELATESPTVESVELGDSSNGGSPTGLTVMGTTTSPPQLGVNLACFQFGQHPAQTVEHLIESLQPIDGLKPVQRGDKATQFLILGPTGRIGALLLVNLVRRCSVVGGVVHCLVRANSLEAGRSRLLAALGPVVASDESVDQMMTHVRPWIGDVTRPNFGLDDTSWFKLCTRVEGIFVALNAEPGATNTGSKPADARRLSAVHGERRNEAAEASSIRRGSGASRLLEAPQSEEAISSTTAVPPTQVEESYYSSVSGVMLDCWAQILSLAATFRVKTVHSITPLLYQLEAPPRLKSSGLYERDLTPRETIIAESQVDSLDKLCKVGLSPHLTRTGCKLWCKGALEILLHHAKTKMNYPICLYRLPPYTFTGGEINNCSHYDLYRTPPMTWHVLSAMVQEGLMPNLSDYLYSLFCNPMDQIVRSIVQLSLNPKPVHWIYHVIPNSHVTREELLSQLEHLAIRLRRVSWEEFVKAVVQRGSGSPIYEYISDISELVMSLPRNVRYGNNNIQHDLGTEVEEWKPCSRFLLSRLISMAHNGLLKEDSNGIMYTLEDVMSLYRVTVTDLGEEWSDLVLTAWTRILTELDSMSSNLRIFTRLVVARTLGTYLKNLKSMHLKEQLYPEIKRIRIKRPIFLLGLTQSGTTLLHNLFAQDYNSNRCPTLLEMLFPYGENGDYHPVNIQNNAPSTWLRDPRNAAAQELIALQFGGQNAPPSILTTEPASYQEDSVPFDMLGRSLSICQKYHLPKHFDWLITRDAQEIRKAYKFHYRFFQHLEHQLPGKRWIFRLPWHLLTIETLLEQYPDAEIVFCHRKPLAALSSWCTFETVTTGRYLYQVDTAKIGPRYLELMSKMLDKFMDYQADMAVRFVQSHPALQCPHSFFVNVYFDELVTSPVVTLTDIYGLLGWEALGTTAEREIWNYLERSLKEKLIKLPSTDLADFSISKTVAKERFKRYLDAYFDPAQRNNRRGEYKIARAIRVNTVDRDEFYTQQGTLSGEMGDSWINTQGFDMTRKSVQSIISFTRSRFSMSE